MDVLRRADLRRRRGAGRRDHVVVEHGAVEDLFGGVQPARDVGRRDHTDMGVADAALAVA